MNYVLYHTNCRDGDGAALAAYLKLGEENTTYIPVQYNRPMPEIENGSNVYILDFSYPKTILEELHQRSKSVLVLDHHKTAMNELQGLPYAKFDMNKSGAVLAWEHFHPGKDIPDLLLDIQDRDLWIKERPNVETTAAGLLLCRDFRDYEKHLYNTDALVSDGSSKLRYDQVELDSVIKKAVIGKWGQYKVAAINTTQLISETGAQLYNNLDIDFAVMWFVTNRGKMVMSLRSNKIDVSQIAAFYGGGGHPAASGCTMSMDDGFFIIQGIFDTKIN